MRTPEEWAAFDRELESLYQTPADAMTVPMWARVEAILLEYARGSVRKCALKYKIPEHTIGELAEDVRAALLQKFWQRKFDNCRSMSQVVRIAAFRALVSRLRKIKSPRTHSGWFQNANTVEPAAPAAVAESDPDLFVEVRNRFGFFRFDGLSLARDAILAARLQSGCYPGPMFLRGIVPERIRKVCYVASVVSINRAMEDLIAVSERHG